MKNIVLIGMPGAGKSTVGVVLAKILGFDFKDSDLLIQGAEGKKLHELIEEHGIEGFLKIEDRVNSQIETENSVIATGGSVCYCDQAMQHLREIGCVIYIKVSYETLHHRLGDLAQRGVVIRNGSTLLDLYNERTPLYEKYAHLTVDVDRCTIEEAIDAISKAAMEQI